MSDVVDRLAKRKESRVEEASIVLDDQLVKDLAELEQERQKIIDDAAAVAAAEESGRKRLASPAAKQAEPDTADVDARIDAKKDEIRANTLRMQFKPVPSARYDELLAEYPEADDNDNELRRFLDILTDESLHAVYLGDDRQDGVSMADLRPNLSGGEMIQIRDLVYLVNRRQAPSIPFSLNGSPKTQ